MIVPSDGMSITEDAIFQPGTYLLPNGITLAADNITLDGNGALLLGHERNGRGVTLKGRRGVTIRNLGLQQYKHGIYAQGCQGLTIDACRITSSAEVEANTIFLDIWLPVEEAYGGAILLHEVADSHVLNNDLQHQMNGLLTYQCRELTVRGNVANYCSGFGFHLYETRDSLFEDNSADYCCRYEPRGERKGHMGADAAGFLIVHNSCRNTFRRNFARLGGDGFFLAGLTPQLERVGCDDNLFEENDGSYSPNIAFEATFSRGNVYRGNIANQCNYGFWLGFSRECVLEHNEINGNRQAGIATENGFDIQVRGNTFKSNTHGILLWSKHISQFAKVVPENDTSRDWLIEGNTFVANGKAMRIAADQDHGVNALPLSKSPRPHHHTIRNNEVRNNRVGIELLDVDDSVIENNRMHDNAEDGVQQRATSNFLERLIRYVT